MPYSIFVAYQSSNELDTPSAIWPEGSEIKGVRKVAISKPLDISLLRETLKKKKISMTDYIVVSAQLALSQIATDVDMIQVSIPFTLKDYPKRLEDLSVGNDFSCLPFKMSFPEVRDLSSFK